MQARNRHYSVSCRHGLVTQYNPSALCCCWHGISNTCFKISANKVYHSLTVYLLKIKLLLNKISVLFVLKRFKTRSLHRSLIFFRIKYMVPCLCKVLYYTVLCHYSLILILYLYQNIYCFSSLLGGGSLLMWRHAIQIKKTLRTPIIHAVWLEHQPSLCMSCLTVNEHHNSYNFVVFSRCSVKHCHYKTQYLKIVCNFNVGFFSIKKLCFKN